MWLHSVVCVDFGLRCVTTDVLQRSFGNLQREGKGAVRSREKAQEPHLSDKRQPYIWKPKWKPARLYACTLSKLKSPTLVHRFPPNFFSLLGKKVPQCFNEVFSFCSRLFGHEVNWETGNLTWFLLTQKPWLITVLSRTRTSQFTEQNELPGQTLTFKGATTRWGAAWIFLLSKYNHDCGGIRAGRKPQTHNSVPFRVPDQLSDDVFSAWSWVQREIIRSSLTRTERCAALASS